MHKSNYIESAVETPLLKRKPVKYYSFASVIELVSLTEL